MYWLPWLQWTFIEVIFSCSAVRQYASEVGMALSTNTTISLVDSGKLNKFLSVLLETFVPYHSSNRRAISPLKQYLDGQTSNKGFRKYRDINFFFYCVGRSCMFRSQQENASCLYSAVILAVAKNILFF